MKNKHLIILVVLMISLMILVYWFPTVPYFLLGPLVAYYGYQYVWKDFNKKNNNDK